MRASPTQLISTGGGLMHGNLFNNYSKARSHRVKSKRITKNPHTNLFIMYNFRLTKDEKVRYFPTLMTQSSFKIKTRKCFGLKDFLVSNLNVKISLFIETKYP